MSISVSLSINNTTSVSRQPTIHLTLPCRALCITDKPQITANGLAPSGTSPSHSRNGLLFWGGRLTGGTTAAVAGGDKGGGPRGRVFEKDSVVGTSRLGGMVSLVARQGRQLQRYTSSGHRLVVGCIPYKFKADSPEEDAIAIDQALRVLVISSQKGQEILFPKGGWEKDESMEEAASREAMEEAGVVGHIEERLGKWWYQSKSQDSRKVGILFPLNVTEELHQWPEMGNRRRRWVTVAEARESCQQPWMRKALDKLVDRLSKG
ncbi:hypothetical protein Taro_031870 [Colocasia esculenta]|uniref:Nudix hydrolase domain-containing protein n=1 Tax=Colocasia esculenta TaxID=4460 RepID=A0A843VVT1_COLES|nr:hypothetical protein [Colocasia esculenta]